MQEHNNYMKKKNENYCMRKPSLHALIVIL